MTQYHYKPTWNAIITGQMIINIGEDGKNLGSLLIAGSYSETATLEYNLVGSFPKS